MRKPQENASTNREAKPDRPSRGKKKNKAFKMTIKKTKIETKQTRKKGIEGWETNKKAKECHMSQQTKKKKKERP